MAAEDLQFSGTTLDTLGLTPTPLTTYSGTLDVDYSAGTVTGSLQVAPALGVYATTYNNFTLSQNTNGSYTINGTGQTANLANSTISLQYSGTAPTKINTQYYVSGTQVASGTNGTVTSTPAPCFASGTFIQTSRGQVAVEDLRVGDLAVTASGEARPVRWLGHRTVDCRRHLRPGEVMPVRIAAHAFGENRPVRDLLVSPGHSICVDVLGEVLIKAIALVNGATIQQVDVDTITYWHVELDSHDVVLAENLPAESYIDCGNRKFFAEADVTALDAAPDAPPAGTDDYCRPFHPAESPLAVAVRERLRLRAEALGWRLAASVMADDLWLEVDGARIAVAHDGLVARAILPATAREVFLCSTTAVPALTTGEFDRRQLGLPITGLVIDDGLACRHEIGTADPRLGDGFYGDEGTHRWSDGRARLPAALWDGVAADFFLRIALIKPALSHWVAPADAAAVELTKVA